MRTARLLVPLLLLVPSLGFAQGKFTKLALEGKDLYATLSTTQGDVVIRFFAKDAPKTVANFVGLATGEKEFVDPKTGEKVKRPYYDGLVFHRVIPDFMIQGGDPEGSGRGGPGYNFEDEFQSGRAFDKVGLLAMANRGPNTNGSQFFITTSTPTYLNGKHTIFGEVIQGYENVVKLGQVPRGAMDRPTVEQKIIKVVISEKVTPKKESKK
ncbi:MAG: peptidylprolyl isomerase [Myxococcaceae bacterium]|jgi:peptidyl-prolyl cis-trans isomerase A (cyclophilin A)|nr:peptidylprolyl isomerase [Myxococcaceae bacterium]